MNVAKMLRDARLRTLSASANLLKRNPMEGHQTRWFGRTSTPVVNPNKINGLCCENSADKAGTHHECCESRAADFQSEGIDFMTMGYERKERQTAPGGSMGCVGSVKPMEGC